MEMHGKERPGDGAGKQGKWLWAAAFLLLLCAQVGTMVYFGGKKAGFHEDEYYSYYSTNRTSGLYEPDREWVDRDTFRNEFVVLPGERFRYGLVATVQSWDVHPPFYYFLLHTVCSLFPGVFSKWLGIGVNLAAFCLNFGLLSWLAYMASGQDKWLTWVAAAVHGFNPVMISGVMFIRMYEWLTVFVLLCACLHVRAVLKGDTGWKRFLLPLMAVNYLGFLTQYYYIIFLCFTAAGFCLWRVGRTTLKDGIAGCVRYGCACGISLAMAVVSYPASLSHIFRGYRGTGAASEFLDVSNTGGRLAFFTGLMDEYLFDGYLWLWLAVIAVMGGVALWKHAKQCGELKAGLSAVFAKGGEGEGTVYFLLLFTACGYFFTVSKTALLLYETSNRYQLPVYGIWMLLALLAAYRLWNMPGVLFRGDNARNVRRAAAGGAVLLLLFMAGDVHGIVSGRVIFLYGEEAEAVAYARENAHTPVVVLYNDATPYHVWWRSQELMEYDRVYFMGEGNKERITDAVICGSSKVIVYAADHGTQEESLRLILEGNPRLAGYRLVSGKSLWSVYEFE